MARTPRQDQGGEITPTSFPEVTPRSVQPTHDFTLQIVGEIQRSIGELAAKTDWHIADVKTQGDKLDRLQHQATFIKGGLAVSVFFITAIVAVAGWILNTKLDALIQTINAIAK